MNNERCLHLLKAMRVREQRLFEEDVTYKQRCEQVDALDHAILAFTPSTDYDAAQARIRELEAALRTREDTLVTMREEYLHMARTLRSARDLLEGEFYAEALGELDDVCSQSDTKDEQGK